MRHRVSRSFGCLVAACLVLASADQAKPHFLRGMTALHNFEYEEANEAFRQARTIDPEFALAYWGEAMTYYQVLWRNENVGAGRRVLADLAPTSSARAAKAPTRREKSLLFSVEVLFGDGDASTRHRLYADTMARLYAEYPDDSDIASLYALALLGTVSRSLIGYSEVGQSPDRQLAGSTTQAQVAAILGKVLQAHPQHHGALHYLLHAYDDPGHARLALDAARTYASVASGASHALHMPAHVFLQLGMWHDAASSDRAAYDASREWTQRKNFRPAMRNFHALAWLEYELLQLGRYRDANRTLDEIVPVATADAPSAQGAHGSHQPLLSDLSSMRARFVIETRRWSMLGRERNFGNVDELLAIGMSAANINNPELADMARQALAQRAQSAQEGDLRPAIAIMEREVAALIARAGGRGNEAIAILEAATRAELALPAPLGLPSPAKPAPELLGEMLLEAGRARDAQQSFEQALRRNANRSLSVLGLARAAAALDDGTTARRHYEQLLANYGRADADVPELVEARTNLEQRRAAASTPVRRAIPIAFAMSTLFAITVLWMRRKALARRRIARKTDSRKTDSPSNKRPPKRRSAD